MFSNEDYLADLLVEAGVVDPDVLDQARRKGGSVIERLLSDTDLSENTVCAVLAQNAGIEAIDLGQMTLTPEVLGSIPDEIARRYKAVPVSDDGVFLTVAVGDPFDFETMDSMPHVLGREISFVCAPVNAIDTLLKQFYGASSSGAMNVSGGHDVEVSDGDAPIIRLVQNMLVDAMKMRASDIHIEPLETSVRIRYRVDGKLIEVDNHPKKLLPAIIARLKVMSGTMSIAEKRLPQDGRVQVKTAEKEIDLRVSSVPSNHGESIVMRILDKSALVLGLPELGFFSDDQALFENLIGLPDGIILVTGPTGSGKTTTLYACLNVINKPDKKIITVEDPVEYELPGINQVMVKTDIGMTFAAALRAMLRQAPNIIMIGEIRDAETANIAINAALTGHLVLSTLHTNDAPSAVARLADIGIKRFLIASAVRAVLAQRLVRKLCPVCKAPHALTDKEARSLRFDPSRGDISQVMGPVGCDKCRRNGFRGRIGIFETFQIDDEVRHMINENLTSSQLRRRARELGMRTLRDDGIRKVLAGLTSPDEVIHVTMSDLE
ncbi:GspE/PulE family protein [Luteolibacter arcticus]|uniref:GspE/PulE family protein n=1 Tax=Luteolibacter arcticus TaxID=1581411 RepID=A0ABT3GJY2_9BACT|nr:GspE/PulE family protein [Luteolibacter arcticus]MCW1923806.1 GspE/PulE family protein [Luteolibacter arcticus]